MKKAVELNIKRFIDDSTVQSTFLRDLDRLQISRSCKIFEKALELFIAKWKCVSADFMSYFESEWIAKNNNWFEACALLVPSTNNALESFHRTIKDEQTMRHRMDLSQFRVKLFNMVEQWAVEYNAGLKIVNNDVPNIDLEIWTHAYNWAKLNARTSIKRRRSNVIYRVVLDKGNFSL